VPDAVATIRCHVHPLVLEVANHKTPRTGLEAKFSVAFCATMGLLRGDAGEREFSEASLGDPVVAGLMARVTPEADASLGMGAARMSVRLADGRVLEERVSAARGTADNPLTRDELEAKFRRLAEVVLPAERVTALVAALRGLVDLPDMAELAALAAA
jgi:2-methylcitrate dehydratase PrpD